MLFFFLAKVDFRWLLSHFEYSFGEEYSYCFDTFDHEEADSQI
jgi:hypothetical protein